MTANEIQKRNERAHQLRVIQVDEACFFVESSDGKICYKVVVSDEEVFCTCGDFARGIKTDQNFACKHIMAVRQSVPSGEVANAGFLEKRKPKLDDRFIMTIKGKEFVVYAGLLDLAHQKGLLKLEAKPVQYPTKENGFEAICSGFVESKDGEVYSDVGDANPRNCDEHVAKHILRVASTRAKARALRDFTNIGITCLDELGSLEDVIAATPDNVN